MTNVFDSLIIIRFVQCSGKSNFVITKLTVSGAIKTTTHMINRRAIKVP